MNLATILGAACVDPFFRHEMFKDPVIATRTYGFYLHDRDLEAAKMIFADEKEMDACFMAVQPQICNKPPCPIQGVMEPFGAALLSKGMLDELFADPIRCINTYGFTLNYQDRYVLTCLVRGVNGAKLKEVLEALRQKISASMTAKAAKAA